MGTRRWGLPLCMMGMLLVFPAAGLGGEAKAPVRIGVVQPLTGNAAYQGTNLLDGIKVAVDEINGRGGILGGRKVEVAVEDDQCNPAQATAVTKKLITEGHRIIVGALCSSATFAVLEVTKKENVVQVAPLSYAPGLTEQGARFFFRTSSNSLIIARGFAEFIAKNEKPGSTIALLVVNDDWGRSDAAAFVKDFERLGNPKVVFNGTFNFQDSDFSTVLSKIKALKPNAMYMVARDPQNSQMVNQMAALGMGSVTVYGSENNYSPSFLQGAGKNAEGVYAVVPWTPDLRDPASVHFKEEYRKKFGKDPAQTFSHSGYSGMWVTALGVDKAGTDTDLNKIREALEKLVWEGPGATWKFDEKHQALVAPHIVQVRSGQYVTVK